MTDVELGATRGQIKRHEGLRLTAYKDSLGFWTIGYGHLLTKGDRPTTERITVDQADALFEGDFQAALAEAQMLALCWDNLTPARQAVLVNMAYNLGYNGLKGFAQTLSHIEGGRYDKAADAMLASKWAKQVGKRAIELSEQMRRGVWLTMGELRKLYRSAQ